MGLVCGTPTRFMPATAAATRLINTLVEMPTDTFKGGFSAIPCRTGNTATLNAALKTYQIVSVSVGCLHIWGRHQTYNCDHCLALFDFLK